MTHHPRDPHESVDEVRYEAVARRVRQRVRRRMIYIANTTLWLLSIIAMGSSNNPFNEPVIIIWTLIWLLHSFWFAYHFWVERAIQRELERQDVRQAMRPPDRQPYDDTYEEYAYDHLAEDADPADLDDLIHGDGAGRKRKRSA